MTYSNLELWFCTLERELTNLGFMEKDKRGKSFIPLEKLQKILNFDKTSLLLGGSLINWGSQPAAYWFDPRLPQVGIMTIKTVYLSTMITGSNAWGGACQSWAKTLKLLPFKSFLR
jgi:hypothetical protein